MKSKGCSNNSGVDPNNVIDVPLRIIYDKFDKYDYYHFIKVFLVIIFIVSLITTCGYLSKKTNTLLTYEVEYVDGNKELIKIMTKVDISENIVDIKLINNCIVRCDISQNSSIVCGVKKFKRIN
jgi:hypothetical protein